MSFERSVGSGDAAYALEDGPTTSYELVRTPRRLRVLSVLDAVDHPVSVGELATRVARLEDVDRDTVRLSLVHNHLPKLADNGVVEYEGDSVELLDNAPVPPGSLVALLEREPSSDRLLETLGHPVRMLVLVELRTRSAGTLEKLASTVANHDRTDLSTVEEARMSLHHAHLPALAEVGALEYDPSTREVSVAHESSTLE